jgi:hypothetical protein
MAASPLAFFLSNKLYQEYFRISISFDAGRAEHFHLLDKPMKGAADEPTVQKGGRLRDEN